MAKIDKEKIGVKAIKGLVGWIPFAGPAFAELVDLMAPDRTEERVEKLEVFYENLSDHERQLIETQIRSSLLSSREDFLLEDLLRSDPSKILKLDTTSKVNGYISGSFWDDDNPYKVLNQQVLESWAPHLTYFENTPVSPFAIKPTYHSFEIACQKYLQGLNLAVDTSSVTRFVTTNTSVDAVGLAEWFLDPVIRNIMSNTANEAQKKRP